jgi:hypothetical protein
MLSNAGRVQGLKDGRSEQDICHDLLNIEVCIKHTHAFLYN